MDLEHVDDHHHHHDHVHNDDDDHDHALAGHKDHESKETTKLKKSMTVGKKKKSANKKWVKNILNY